MVRRVEGQKCHEAEWLGHIHAENNSPGQSGLIRRDREIRIFGYFSFFMHARIISERDFQTIHLKIITPKKAFLGSNDLISL